MTLPSGTFLSAMSYARDGVPNTSQGSYVTVSDHHGIGYELPDGAVMFQFSECQNWSIAHPSSTGTLPGQQFTNTSSSGSGWVPLFTPVGFSGGGDTFVQPASFFNVAETSPPNWPTVTFDPGPPPPFAPVFPSPKFDDPPDGTPRELIPPVPPFTDAPPLPTPIPSAALFLVSGLILLMLFARRKAAA
ncbi:MAG: hypothetical protein AAGC86_10780 [Pseudomonadota bacterium]